MRLHERGGDGERDSARVRARARNLERERERERDLCIHKRPTFTYKKYEVNGAGTH